MLTKPSKKLKVYEPSYDGEILDRKSIGSFTLVTVLPVSIKVAYVALRKLGYPSEMLSRNSESGACYMLAVACIVMSVLTIRVFLQKMLVEKLYIPISALVLILMLLAFCLVFSIRFSIEFVEYLNVYEKAGNLVYNE